MQTYFRNPLAGPYVLGLSAGSGLGVAILILGSSILPIGITSFMLSSYSIVLASALGSLFVLLGILYLNRKTNSSVSILIIGLMFGSFASALVSVLSYFSTAEELKKYTIWTMGNIGGLSWEHVMILLLTITTGTIIGFTQIKPLNALMLGENYALSMGINLNKSKYLLLISTSILTGCVTAFVGPIAFVGLAVPHATRLIFKSSHHETLFIGTALFGGITLLFCDAISQIPGTSIILPINAITSIIGAPVVIGLILRKSRFL